MSITVQSIVNKARLVLQDPGVRYLDAEMLAWANEGQLAIYAVRKDASTQSTIQTLVEGTKQSIATGAELLLDVVRAVSPSDTPGRAIRRVEMTLLDAQAPNWHTDTPSAYVSEYMYDPREPKVFYVYPPATVGAKVLTKTSVPPTPAATIGANISIDDVYDPILVDYLLYRAYSKETEGALRDRAILYKQAFDAALSNKGTTDEGENARVIDA